MTTSKTALSLIGGGLIIQGLIFYGFAGPLTAQNFPGASDEAQHVGVVMRGGLAGLSLLAGVVIFLARQAAPPLGKRLLFGCAIGFAAISLIMIKILLDHAAVVPLPALGLYLATSGFALATAVKKDPRQTQGQN